MSHSASFISEKLYIDFCIYFYTISFTLIIFKFFLEEKEYIQLTKEEVHQGYI